MPFFARKSVNTNVSLSASPKLALVPASHYYCDINWSYRNCLCQVSLGLKKVQMEANDFKLNKVPLFARKPGNINVSRSAAPKLDLVPANRYDCDLKLSYVNVCAKFH